MRTRAKIGTSGILVVAVMAGALGAQTPRFAPPPPCRADAVPGLASLLSRPESPRQPVIAILQLEARLTDDSHAHVAWALAERVRARLIGSSAVVVPTRGTTERAWAEAGGRPEHLTTSLGASLVVTGLVSSERDGARVEVRFVTRTDSSAWRGTYKYPSLPLDAIEDEVVTAVARHVGIEPRLRGPGVPTGAAFDALARGDYFLASHDAVATDSARAAFERALAAQPKSTRAMERLARAYAVALERGASTGSLSRAMALREATALIDRAIEADASFSDAWTTRALLQRASDPVRFAGATASHERAVRAAPRNADARHEYARTLLLLGRDDAARAQAREALAAERDRPASLVLLGELEYLARRYDASCALTNASIGADSYDPTGYALRARVRVKLGEFRDAFADAETAARLSGASWGDALQFYATSVARESDVVQSESRRLVQSRLRPGTTLDFREAVFLGMAFSAAGDRTRAFEALSRSGPASARLRTALRDPGLDPLRSDPRFRRIGVAEGNRPPNRVAEPAAERAQAGDPRR